MAGIMTLPRLFCRDMQEGNLTLDEAEAHHARSVLRLKSGDAVTLLDGQGGEASAVIDRVTKRDVSIVAQPCHRHAFDVPRRVTIAVALPRRHRQSYLVEKCTELGAAAIWLVDVERQVTKPDMETAERFARRAAEALKQCGRHWLPSFTGPMSLNQALRDKADFDAVVLLHPGPAAPLLSDFLAEHAPANPERPPRILFLIGPEGGWSDADRLRAVELGANMVTLGSIVLRTETAAVAACALATLGG